MERTSPVNLRISDAGLALIAEHEGCVLHAYDDADPTHRPIKPGDVVHGTLTIGHGHTRTATPGMRITQRDAIDLLRSDVREAESYVHRFVKVDLAQCEHDALTSLIFNVGAGRQAKSNGPDDKGRSGIIILTSGKPSSLLVALNEGKYSVAAEWFTAWRSKGTAFELGLFRRRVCEMLMFLGLPYVRALNAIKTVQFAIPEALRLAAEEKEALDFLGAKSHATVILETPAKAPSESQDARQGNPATQPAKEAPTSSKDSAGGIPSNPPPAVEQASANAKAEVEAVRPDPQGLPAPDQAPASPAPPLDLTKPIPADPVSAVLPPVKREGQLPQSPSPSKAAAAPPLPAPVGTKPPSVNTKMPEHVPYQIDPNAGLKPMEETERFVGAAMMFFGTMMRVGMANGMKLSGFGGILIVALLDFMKSPTNLAIAVSVFAFLITSVLWMLGFVIDKTGLHKKKRGERNATQGMY